MSAWTADRISIWVPPLDGEALDSWLEAYARRLRTTGAEFTRFLGLTAHPKMLVRTLTTVERATLSRSTGLSSTALTRMTLERFDGPVVAINPQDRAMKRPPAWRHYGSRSRFCPACLQEDHGRWQLSWRLPWSFACTRHQVLLHDYCPSCGHPPPVSASARTKPSRPGKCLYLPGTGGAVTCGGYLPDSPGPTLLVGGAVVAAQRIVNHEVLADGADGAQGRGQELYVLALRALRALRGVRGNVPAAPPVVGDILAECGGPPPWIAARDEGKEAHSTAIGTTLAMIATDARHPASEEVFAWLRSTDRPRASGRDYATRLAHEWLPAGPRVASRILKAADGEITLIARIRHGTATPAPSWPALSDDGVRFRAAKLPAMLWPSWAFRLLPSGAGAHVTGFRRACASLMLAPGTRWDQLSAAALLGNSNARANRRALDAALTAADVDILAAVLPALARALDAHSVPIDYHRRRSLFTSGTVTFDLDAYQALCRRHGWPPRAQVRNRHLRWHLTRMLLGADPGAASCAPHWHPLFHYRLHPALQQFLHDQAVENLQAHEIAEPVAWEPPGDWICVPGLPSGPEVVDRSLFARHAADGPSVGELANLHGLDEAHLLLTVEVLGITAPLPVEQLPSRGRRVPRQGVLAPHRLRQLYQEQRLGQRAIAGLAGCGVTTVQKALREADIPNRYIRPASNIEQSLTPG